jgi:uncharacterized protein (DUF3820 family)
MLIEETATCCHPRMPFGKHKYQPLCRIPASYLRWCLEECVDNWDPALLADLKEELDRRARNRRAADLAATINRWGRHLAKRHQRDPAAFRVVTDAAALLRGMLGRAGGGEEGLLCRARRRELDSWRDHHQ